MPQAQTSSAGDTNLQEGPGDMLPQEIGLS